MNNRNFTNFNMRKKTSLNFTKGLIHFDTSHKTQQVGQ